MATPDAPPALPQVHLVLLMALGTVLLPGCAWGSAEAEETASLGGADDTAGQERAAAPAPPPEPTPQQVEPVAAPTPEPVAEPTPEEPAGPTPPPHDAGDPDVRLVTAPAGGIDARTQALIRRVLAPIRQCYEQELQRDPSFRGTAPPPSARAVPHGRRQVRMELVGTSGSPRVDRCLRAALRRMTFERDEREVHIQYPFLFAPDGSPRSLPAGGPAAGVGMDI